jgi:hypothetical protein
MYINITDSKTADNKGSCGNLVNYLEKENRMDHKNEPEMWFNQNSQHIEPYEVRRGIDNNIAKLGKADAKFFLVNISPSQKELEHLTAQYGHNPSKAELKEFAVHVMDEYARNFERPGIDSSVDLLWYGKLENHRYFTRRDPEVKSGGKKRGDLKKGNQMHLQIIVSRKDATNKIKLSPMNTSRGINIEHSKKMGQFNRVEFKQCGERVFDNQFDFQRGLKDTMAYANILKNGSLAQREQLGILEKAAEIYIGSKPEIADLAGEVTAGLFSTSADMVQSIGKTAGELSDILLEPVYAPIVPEPVEQAHKKRKKCQAQEQSMMMSR